MVDAAVAKEDKKASDFALEEAAKYGYEKTSRGFKKGVLNLVLSIAALVKSILGAILTFVTFGVGAIIDLSIGLVVMVIQWGKTLYEKIKGFKKYVKGERGVDRRINATKIVLAAQEGSDEALDLILKLDLSGIAGGSLKQQFRFWKRSGNEEGDQENKDLLKHILKEGDKGAVNKVIEGVAESLKSK